jgi:hypothetical protein
MPIRIVALALAGSLALTSIAQADPVQPLAATPIRDSVARLALPPSSVAVARQVAQAEPAAMKSRVQSAPSRDGGILARKIVFASILGFAGFIGGGKIGAQIDGDCGGCDDPGLKGALIGAPIGATMGAIVGWQIAK